MLHIYTGDGKGKTTAALGLCLRASGRGRRIAFFQFLKDGNSGENFVFQKLDNFKILCFQTETKGFFWEMTEEEKTCLKKETEKGFLCAQEYLRENLCDMLVLDEISGCIKNELISEDALLRLIKAYKEKCEIVLTGREFSEDIIEISDYCSSVSDVKHPYQKGVDAKEGIEF
ncbi:MAG: cob(I)yrinic acid a,c-diamide adenosyltransferase [Clostridia bacterium]|nr:cob(I)yrinic acid a,c-diamide adenosyltransferase [Clostridia bacterium]